ncbi:MAG: cation:proton antiporter [Alphaproteobacteria bacterium]
MALGLAEIAILGLFFDYLFRKAKLPGLLGMLVLGIILGSNALNLIRPELIDTATDFRTIALVVILLRAGLSLSRETLAEVGFRAILLSFIPATCEIVGITLVAPKLLGITPLEATLLGTVLAAVSPAVIVPLMLDFIQKKRGGEKGVPTLVLAGASIDDINVIVANGIFLMIYLGKQTSIVTTLINIPISIFTGIIIGTITGFILCKLFEKFNPRATKRVLIIIAIAILFINLEKNFSIIAFSPLLASMVLGFIILEYREYMAHEIAAKLAKIWIFAEILLFTLIGSQLNIKVALATGLAGFLVLILGLVARSIGVLICLIKSKLNFGERIFVIASYLPKATVQAAIGAVPLAAMKANGMNSAPGEIILSMAVISIIITAPIGAFIIKILGNKYLETKGSFNEYRASSASFEKNS